jgi:D-aminopeptidase
VKARELGLYFGPTPTGRFNAITDVPGVTVGQVSIFKGEGKLIPGVGPVRTGVTAILPHGGNLFTQKCAAGVHAYNGYGKSTGIIWTEELGLLENPIMLTNSMSISSVRIGTDYWVLKNNPGVGIWERTPNVMVFECDDSYLNDIRGMHVKPEHALQAISSATGGVVQEGNSGAGVGMSCFQFKGGVGTCSRVFKTKSGLWSMGVLVLANFGVRQDLIIKGVPVGELIPYQPEPLVGSSVIIVVATDAPLSNLALKRLSKRPVLGLARTGFISHHGSGDLVLAFSNYRWVHGKAVDILEHEEKDPDFVDTFFKAAIDASEEALLNALFQAENMVGRDNHLREKIPVGRVLDLLTKYNRRPFNAPC